MCSAPAAIAQVGGSVTPPPPAPATTPAQPAPTPRIRFDFVDGRNRIVDAAFPHQGLKIIGSVQPFVAGQTVTVTFRRGTRVVAVRNVPIRSAGHDTGHFTAQIPVGGRYGVTFTVDVAHAATALLGAGASHPRTVPVVPNGVPSGYRGEAARFLQRLLAGRHYAVPQSGVMDAATGRAVEAFRKVTGLARTQVADGRVLGLLARGAGHFVVRHPEHGRHFEADLSHQVLAEVLPGGRVRAIYIISSGKPSTPTVVGTFRVYDKSPGINHKGMVDSSYFIRGYAIHGYAEVPNYPASHGCLRVPVPNAAAIFSWSKIGEIVDVYYRNGRGSHHLRGNAGP